MMLSEAFEHEQFIRIIYAICLARSESTLRRAVVNIC